MRPFAGDGTRKPLILAVVALTLLAGACRRGPQYYLDAGNKYMTQQRYDDAELNYRKAIQKNSDFGEAYYRLGLLELHRQNNIQAYSWLRQADSLLPGREDVEVQFADVSSALYLSDRRHPRALYDQVTSIANKLTAQNPRSFDGLRLKGVLASIDKRFPEAEDYYRQANAIKPLQPQLALAWTETLFEDGKASEAESLATQLIGKDKTFAPIYAVLYRYYMHENRLADAERILQTEISNNPADAGARIRLAAFYGGVSREGDMKIALQQMLDQPRTFPQARAQIGDLYRQMRRWDDALQQYQTGARAAPSGANGTKERIVYLKRIADLWLAQNKPEQAYQTAAAILRQDPNDQSAQIVQASLLLNTRNPANVTKAIATFRGLAAKDASNANLHFDLGRALAAGNDPTGAKGELTRAIQLNPRFIEPRLALIQLSQSAGDYAGALGYADQALTLNPNLSAIRLVRAVSLMHTGNEAKGRTELDALAREFPQNREVRLQVALADLREKNVKEAEDELRKLNDSSPTDIRSLKGLADALTSEKEADKALALLDEDVRKSPKDLRLRSLLASTAITAGKYDMGIQQYQQLTAAVPSSAPFALALSQALQAKGDSANALVWARKAQTLAPNNVDALMNLGTVLARSDRPADALSSYRQALKIQPENVAALNGAARLIAENGGGSLDDAMTMAQKAVKSDPSQPAYTDTLGLVYLKKNDQGAAYQVFHNLTDKYPDDPTYHYHLALLFINEANRGAAQSELKAALDAHPAADLRPKIESALAQAGH